MAPNSCAAAPNHATAWIGVWSAVALRSRRTIQSPNEVFPAPIHHGHAPRVQANHADHVLPSARRCKLSATAAVDSHSATDSEIGSRWLEWCVFFVPGEDRRTRRAPRSFYPQVKADPNGIPEPTGGARCARRSSLSEEDGVTRRWATVPWARYRSVWRERRKRLTKGARMAESASARWGKFVPRKCNG
jgi:hypothetical protein